MERKQAHEFPQELLDLFDKYVHGDIDRRAFLDGAQRFATSRNKWRRTIPASSPRGPRSSPHRATARSQDY
jgi:carboxymethylenebutenolidase